MTHAKVKTEDANRRIEAVASKLKTYANEWPVFIAEDGEEKARRAFRTLVREAKRLGLQTTDRYPDGEVLS